ncbi:MAG: hypothetical protein AABY22_05730, partial [Nanoarchaeota archaeon]
KWVGECNQPILINDTIPYYIIRGYVDKKCSDMCYEWDYHRIKIFPKVDASKGILTGTGEVREIKLI